MPKLITSLALPTVISTLITSIYNMADTYFVSHLGTNASAAVGIVFAIQSFIQAAGCGIGMGASSLISRSLGKRDAETASKYTMSAIVFALAVGLALLSLGIFNIDGVMRIFGADSETLPYAREYGRYVLMTAPIMCTSFVLNTTLRAEGKARFAMVGLATGAILNILLDPLFIYDIWLGMGTAGAAIATSISQLISFFILLTFFLMKRTEVTFSFKYVSHNIHDYILIIKTGVPTVCRQGLASVATTFLNRQARIYGSTAVAAVTIANKLYLFVRNIIIGIGQAFQPVAGYNYGAQKYKRVKQAFSFSVFLGTVVVSIATVLFLTKSNSLISFFIGDDEPVIAIGSLGLKFLCMSLPLMGYSTYVNQIFQCLGKVKRATFLASCRNGVFYLPCIFILPHYLGLNGVLLTQPIADILTCVISVPFHLTFFKELDRMENAAELTQ